MSNTKETVFVVTGMTCGHCERATQNVLSELAGITAVVADHNADRVTITHDGPLPAEDVMKAAVEEEGYKWVGRA